MWCYSAARDSLPAWLAPLVIPINNVFLLFSRPRSQHLSKKDAPLLAALIKEKVPVCVMGLCVPMRSGDRGEQNAINGMLQ